MTQVEDDKGREADARAATAAAAAPPAASPQASRDARITRRIAVWLGIVLFALLGLVAVSPFWAPAVAPLLPWGEKTAIADSRYQGLAGRVAVLEQRPSPTPVDLGAVKSAEAALGQRLDRLEAAEKSTSRETADAEARAAIASIKERLAGIDGQVASQRTATDAMQQDLSRLGDSSTSLGKRMTAVEQQVREEKSADRSDAALLLALLQMREAVTAARPFPGEYAAFQALARDRPDLTAAAAPLAAAAREGIAGREVLKERLAALADRIAETAEPASGDNWWDEALARLRGLVSIRHLGAPPSGPEAVVAGAQTMLAGGDLKGAVAAIGTLDGADAKLAEPWLRMARGRLEAEQALARLQEMLVARLGGLPGPAQEASPNANPAPAKTGSP